MGKPLSALDIAFLAIESSANPAHVAILQIFELPTDADASSYFKTLISTLKGCGSAEPPFNHRLGFSLTGVPRWITEGSVDLDYHLSHCALPHPGGVNELMELIGGLHSRRLDRARPLWETHIIEGLTGNRFACYIKIHHAMIDGTAGLRRIEDSLDPDPAADLRALWQQKGSSAGKAMKKPTPDLQARVRRALGGVRGGIGLAAELGGIFGRAGKKMLGASQSAAPAPFAAPKSELNVKISAARKLSTITLPLTEVKEIGAAANATVNDVVMAIAAGALRRFLLGRDALPDADLVALMPVSVTRQGGPKPGNNISYIFASLATTIEDPIERLAVICRSTSDAKAEVASMSAAGAIAFAAAAQGGTALIKTLELTEVLPPPANLVISNIPGPRRTLYMMGSRMVAMYPVSSIIDGQALNISVTSHADALDFGLTACKQALPDLDRLANMLGVAHEELRAAILGARKRRPAVANGLPTRRARAASRRSTPPDQGPQQ